MRRYLNLIRYHRNWYAYLWYKFFTGRMAPLTLKTRSGNEIEIPAPLVFTYKECFMDTTYLKGFPKAIHLHVGASVVDIGANVGYFSLFMHERFPRVQVYSYEPVPANYSLLSEHHGKFRNLNWRIFNKAINGTAGTLTLHDEKTGGYTTAASIFNDDQHGETIEVEAITLEDACKENGITAIDFLKLDCEGAEYSILYNTPNDVLSRIKYIAAETHLGKEPSQTRESLEAYLQKHGFRTWAKRSKIWAVSTSL